MTTLRLVRLALVAAGVSVAAPSFASVVPLCGDHDHDKGKDTNADNKNKSENKDNKKEEKKPANPA